MRFSSCDSSRRPGFGCHCRGERCQNQQILPISPAAQPPEPCQDRLCLASTQPRGFLHSREQLRGSIHGTARANGGYDRGQARERRPRLAWVPRRRPRPRRGRVPGHNGGLETLAKTSGVARRGRLVKVAVLSDQSILLHMWPVPVSVGRRQETCVHLAGRQQLLEREAPHVGQGFAIDSEAGVTWCNLQGQRKACELPCRAGLPQIPK